MVFEFGYAEDMLNLQQCMASLLLLLFLTPKGPSPFFSKNTSKLPFLAQEAQMKFYYIFALSTIGSCPRLLGEHVQKVLQKLTAPMVRL
jgi:hypothetical protein